MASRPGPAHPDGALRSPEVARWALTRTLRNRRVELGIPTARIAEQLGISRARWSQIENDHHMITDAMLPKLAQLFEFDAETAEYLRALRSAAGETRWAWWLHYAQVLPPNFIRYCGMEYGASSMRSFSSTLAEGLLQTPEYTYRLISNNSHVSEFDRRKVAEVREKRQERLRTEPRLRLHAIIYEAVLFGSLGSPSILKGQLDHIAHLIEELNDTLQIQVMPFSALPCGLSGSAVHLLDYDREDLRMVVWDEALFGDLQTEDTLLADSVNLMFDRAAERSLDRDESYNLILKTARNLDGKSP